MEENYTDYPLWEQNLEKDIQGIFDRELDINNVTAEEWRPIDMDERIDSYLRGQMTKEEESQFISDCKNNKELKKRAYMIALLVKSLKRRDNEEK
jgi:predicted RNA-binding protein associated with RNAse of E/G family